MPIASSRHALVALFVVCSCASLGACGNSQTDDATPSPSASVSVNAAPQAIQSNELQDWARQVAGQSNTNTNVDTKAAAAPASSDALAPPVIHTVD